MIWLRLVSAKWCAGVDAWLHPGDVALVTPEEAPYWTRGYAVPMDPQPALSGAPEEVRLRVKLLVPGQLLPVGALFSLPSEAAAALLALGAAQLVQDEILVNSGPAPDEEGDDFEDPGDEPDPEEDADVSSDTSGVALDSGEDEEPEDEPEAPQAFYYKGEEARIREDGMVVDLNTGEDYATEAAWKSAVTKRLKAELGG